MNDLSEPPECIFNTTCRLLVFFAKSLTGSLLDIVLNFYSTELQLGGKKSCCSGQFKATSPGLTLNSGLYRECGTKMALTWELKLF